jgi:MoxR-like ATPase
VDYIPAVVSFLLSLLLERAYITSSSKKRKAEYHVSTEINVTASSNEDEDEKSLFCFF